MGITDTTDDEIEVKVAFIGDTPHAITATLRNARRSEQLGRPLLLGNVYGDRLERFADGTRIHTSFITQELSKNVFLTRSNNIYRVESWSE